MPESLPRIVTLQLDSAAQLLFDQLREAYFPPDRNFLKAHLTLFHQLPDDPEISITLQELAQRNPLDLRVSELKMIGNGVAYKIDCQELKDLHKVLRKKWEAHLIPQDRQAIWPHVTIQNKVDSSVARQLYERLRINFEPFTIRGTGFQLWEYQNGPWQWLRTFPFHES